MLAGSVGGCATRLLRGPTSSHIVLRIRLSPAAREAKFFFTSTKPISLFQSQPSLPAASRTAWISLGLVAPAE